MEIKTIHGAFISFGTCFLENSIKSLSSMEYADDAVDKSDQSVHLTTGKKLF